MGASTIGTNVCNEMIAYLILKNKFGVGNAIANLINAGEFKSVTVIVSTPAYIRSRYR